jgi:hypothetical protein
VLNERSISDDDDLLPTYDCFMKNRHDILVFNENLYGEDI